MAVSLEEVTVDLVGYEFVTGLPFIIFFFLTNLWLTSHIFLKGFTAFLIKGSSPNPY